MGDWSHLGIWLSGIGGGGEEEEEEEEQEKESGRNQTTPPQGVGNKDILFDNSKIIFGNEMLVAAVCVMIFFYSTSL